MAKFSETKATKERITKLQEELVLTLIKKAGLPLRTLNRIFNVIMEDRETHKPKAKKPGYLQVNGGKNPPVKVGKSTDLAARGKD